MLKKYLIIGFVLWHAFAVMIYPIPRDSTDAMSIWAREHLMPIVSPYILSTTQWQLWNLFSPDPLRRVTFYGIDIMEDGEWKRIDVIKPGTYSIVRHAFHFKMMNNLFDGDMDDVDQFADRFMQLYCKEKHVGAGTMIRMQLLSYVIPFVDELQPSSWWKEWEPIPGDGASYVSNCPEAS